MKLKTFTGFKGKIAFAQRGQVMFVLMARNQNELAAAWSVAMPGVALDPAGIKSCILIEASTLPDQKGAVSVTGANPNPDALDRLNAELESETKP